MMNPLTGSRLEKQHISAILYHKPRDHPSKSFWNLTMLVFPLCAHTFILKYSTSATRGNPGHISNCIFGKLLVFPNTASRWNACTQASIIYINFYIFIQWIKKFNKWNPLTHIKECAAIRTQNFQFYQIKVLIWVRWCERSML